MKVVVTGARGLLGSQVMRTFATAAQVSGWSSGEHDGYRRVDVRDATAVARGLDTDAPDVVVHCAADPDVVSCQDDPDGARELNTLAVQRMAAATAQRGIALVQISTDFVFSGARERYTEDDEPDPLQVYGRTKADAEPYVRELERGLVVRLPLLFGSSYELHRSTFPEDVARKLRAGERVGADGVELRQPTYTRDVADVLLQLAERGVTGVVHAGAPSSLTKYDWAHQIAGRLGLDPGPIESTVPGPLAPRPARAFLQDTRLAELGLAVPSPVEVSTSAFLADAGLLN
jgi:dTDP-4-dehydrorhamnose reductase